MPPAAVDTMLAAAREEVETGRLPSCQVALARDGEVVTAATYGAATSDSRYVVFSVTKAVTAGVVWLALGDGLLAPETRVVDVVPEFATNGKEAVTLEHLLTHTAGFARAPIRPTDDAARRLERYAQWRLDSPPGERTEYSTVAYHWVVGELLTRVTGTDHRDLANAMLDGIGLSRLRLGVPEAAQGDVEMVEIVEGTPTPGVEVPVHVPVEHVTLYNAPAARAAGVPGAGAVSTASDVALFYQRLLHGGPWDPAVLADGTGHVRNALDDPWTHVPANRTLGLVVAGDDGKSQMRQFGRAVGPRAFGAAGIGGQIAWADPDSGLSFSFLTNGISSDPVASFMRADKLSTLAARC